MKVKSRKIVDTKHAWVKRVEGKVKGFLDFKI